MADFTSSSAVFNFYSAFWTRLFGDTEVFAGWAEAQAMELVQVYQDFVETVNRVSTRRIPVFHREKLYPLIITESKFSQSTDLLRYGRGFVYGPQPAGTAFKEGATFLFGGVEQRSSLFFFDLPSDVKDVGNVIINRLFSPSVMLGRGTDFTLDDGVIAFVKNPFLNPLIPKRTVPGPDGLPDQQIVLWLTEVDTEQNALYQQYGFIFSQFETSSEEYRLAIEYVIKAFARGPSIGMLDTLVAVLAGVPIVAEAQEVVVSVETFGEKRFVFTDVSVYEVPPELPLRPEIVTGAHLRAGDPLTLVTQVIDITTNSSWWREVPGITLGASYFHQKVKAIGFLNANSTVKVVDQVDPEDGNTRIAEFDVVGTAEDVHTFWSYIQQQSESTSVFLAPGLWKKAGVLDDSGNPDYDRAAIINPLQFLVEEMIGTNLLIVRISSRNLTGLGKFLGALTLLKQATPAHMSTIIFLDLQLSDDVPFYGEDGVERTTIDLEDTAALISGRTADFSAGAKAAFATSSTAEALSMDDSMSILVESLNLGNSSMLKESVAVRSVESCAP